MKALVVYSSQTSNTKKVAEGLAAELGCDMVALADAADLSDYELVVVGFWYKAGQPDPASQEFLAKLAGKKVFLFATHGAAVGSPPAENGMAKAKELAGGAQVIGSFSCPGEVDEKFLAMAAKKDPQPPWLGAAPAAKGHPDASDVAAARAALRAAL
ncbi:MAG: flavodoxin family protein [Thermodesulfobacteriota bacterium]